MDSSPPFRLRTAIVVVSMIALPVIAVCGFKLPKFFAWAKSDSTATATSPPSTSRPAANRPGSEAKTETPPGTSISLAHGHNNAGEHEATDPHVIQAGGGNHAEFDPNNASFPIKQTANSDVRGIGSAGPPGGDESAKLYPLPSPTEDAADLMPPPVVVAEQFSTIQQRLRAMGATHYVLETWGPQGDMYRFQCRMSAGHHPNYTRQFEAIDGDALRVMQTVLEEIDAWKAGRLP